MTTETKVDNRYTTKEKARMLFGHITTPAVVGKKGTKGDPQYSITIGLPAGADLVGLKAKAIAVAKATWPGRALQNPNAPQDPRSIQLPFKSAKARADEAKTKGRDGAIYNDFVYTFDARSGMEYPPQIAIRDADGTIRLLEGTQVGVEGKQKFYNGCFVGVSVSFKAYHSQSEGGIGAYSGVKAFLSSVIWLADGPRIGGNATETFRHYAGEVTTENPLETDAF
jgi:hypothetical protein